MKNHSKLLNHPGIAKRLIAALYDSLLVLATIFIASALTLPFTGGEARGDSIFMSLYLLIVMFIFFGWFWTHGGQTLGMRAWKIKIAQDDGNQVTWLQAFIRFITGLPAWSLLIYGLISWMVPDRISLLSLNETIPEWLIVIIGFCWVCLDNRSENWRDKLSHTRIILLNR